METILIHKLDLFPEEKDRTYGVSIERVLSSIEELGYRSATLDELRGFKLGPQTRVVHVVALDSIKMEGDYHHVPTIVFGYCCPLSRTDGFNRYEYCWGSFTHFAVVKRGIVLYTK
jgi:hypothetical protein